MVGGEILKWRQLTHNQLMSPLGPHLSPHSTAKTIDKSTNLVAFIGISDVVTASILRENPSEEVDDYDNYYYYYYSYEYIARNDIFSRAPEIDFRYETKARKVMVDYKFDALYR